MDQEEKSGVLRGIDKLNLLSNNLLSELKQEANISLLKSVDIFSKNKFTNNFLNSLT